MAEPLSVIFCGAFVLGTWEFRLLSQKLQLDVGIPTGKVGEPSLPLSWRSKMAAPTDCCFPEGKCVRRLVCESVSSSPGPSQV